MCRIAGIIEKYPSSDRSFKLNRMLDALAHGGPDDSGIFTEQGVHLGHRRLSIIDLSPLGKQPMMSLEEDVVVSFSGEIYNFQSIKKELLHLGFRFITATDTEVILNAYKKWGTDCFSKFNGMFALAIYDRTKRQLILARNPSGIKPLYYALSKERLVFASEVRAFYQFRSDWEENPNWKALFLAFGSLPFPYTTLKEVQMLKKGAYLLLDLNDFSAETVTYHTFSFSDSIRDPREAQQLVRDKLIHAVERHLISDAPIGVFLSGGIDSSLLALLADFMGKEDLQTVSVNFKEASYDETPYQRLVLERIKSTHSANLIDEQVFLESWEDIFRAMDQPSIDGVNTYFVSKSARQAGLKSVLSGLGADEYFGGYPSFRRIESLNRLKRVPFKKVLGKLMGSVKDEWKRISWLHLEDTTVGDYLCLRGLFDTSTIAQILGCSEKQVWDSISQVQLSGCPGQESPFYADYLESNVYMENQLLRDTDCMSMWHGLEVRVPFLDKELVTLALGISPELKLRRSSPKYLLSETFCDLLPDGVVFRKKQGFVFPFENWLRNNPYLVDHLIPSHQVGKKISQKFDQGEIHWSKYWAISVIKKYNYSKK